MQDIIQRALSGIVIAAFLVPFAMTAELAPKSEADVVVYDGEYPGWPWITKAADGTLCCILREGTIHGYSPSGRAMLAKSADNGQSWSEAEVIYDLPEVDDRNSAIVELPNEDLLVCFNTYNASKESVAMVMRSSDGGTSWSEPTPTDASNTRTRSAPIVLENGNILLPYYIAPGEASLAGLSEDNGRTWVTVEIPNTEGFIGDEWDVLEVEPDRLVGLHRNSHPDSDGTFWKSESRDGGKTWDIPVATNVRSKRLTSPPHLALHNGILTLIYADRRMVSVSAVTTSDPKFVVWDVENRLPCYIYNADESPIPDGSYPCSVQIDRNTRLIVDYEIRESTKRIAGYFVEFPEDWGRP